MVYELIFLLVLLLIYSLASMFIRLIKKFYFFINKKKRIENENEYIIKQKQIDENNRKYYEYLDWMQKNSEGIPLEKIKTKEEFEADLKIKSLMK